MSVDCILMEALENCFADTKCALVMLAMCDQASKSNLEWNSGNMCFNGTTKRWHFIHWRLSLQGRCYSSRLLTERQSGNCRTSRRCCKDIIAQHTRSGHRCWKYRCSTNTTRASSCQQLQEHSEWTWRQSRQGPFSLTHTTLPCARATHTTQLCLTQLSHTSRLFHIQLLKTIDPPPFPLSFLPSPYRFNQCLWLLEKADLWVIWSLILYSDGPKYQL